MNADVLNPQSGLTGQAVVGWLVVAIVVFVVVSSVLFVVSEEVGVEVGGSVAVEVAFPSSTDSHSVVNERNINTIINGRIISTSEDNIRALPDNALV